MYNLVQMEPVSLGSGDTLSNRNQTTEWPQNSAAADRS